LRALADGPSEHSRLLDARKSGHDGEFRR
jgi:hypothetical protein